MWNSTIPLFDLWDIEGSYEHLKANIVFQKYKETDHGWTQIVYGKACGWYSGGEQCNSLRDCNIFCNNNHWCPKVEDDSIFVDITERIEEKQKKLALKKKIEDLLAQFDYAPEHDDVAEETSGSDSL